MAVSAIPEFTEYVHKDKKVRLHFHSGQDRAWASEARFTFVIAGTQGGKTCFGPWWLWREIKQCGPGDYLAVTATYDLFKLKMLPEMLRVFCGYLRSEGWQWQATDRVFTNPDGSRIILRSADAEGGLESASAKAAWLDECGQNRFGLGAWEAVQRRLSLARGRALGTTTPYNLGWLKTEVFDRWRDGDKDYNVVQFDSTENPVFPQDELERARQTLPDWKYRMFYRGQFTRPAGLVYECWDDETHVIDDAPIPAHWRRIVGIDFGATNHAEVWLAQNPKTGRWIAYKERHGGGRTTRELAVRMATELLGFEHRAVGGSSSEVQQRRDWTDAGMRVEQPPIGDLQAGIDRVHAGLKTGNLLIMRSLRGLRAEFGSYEYETDDRGEVTSDKIEDREKYHRLDALRYAYSAASTPRRVAGSVRMT